MTFMYGKNRLFFTFQFNKEYKTILTLPTAVDPVKEMVATLESSHSLFPIAGELFLEQVTTLITPGGIFASSTNCAKARADKGVSSAGLMTHVHPAARAAPTFLVIIAFGKFHCQIKKS